MSVNDELGKRMKNNYENVSKTSLIRRMPVMIRIDGKAFHTFTHGFKKPFDKVLMESMEETMKYLCENVMGCVLGYTQSDEITLVLVDYKKFESQAWFDNEVQKICSISASMATLEFNRAFSKNVDVWFYKAKLNASDKDNSYLGDVARQYDVYKDALYKGAMFDSRCFNVPKEEVTNFVYWRQLDATRNSVEALGRAYFSHKQLYKKNQNDIQNMLFSEYGVNWNECTTSEKRGSCCIKETYNTKGEVERSRWIIDHNIPIFKDKGREYIEKLINF